MMYLLKLNTRFNLLGLIPGSTFSNWYLPELDTWFNLLEIIRVCTLGYECVWKLCESRRY